MTIESLVNPEMPESIATHLKEGFIMGWIVGFITDINDVDKLGRVKCKVPFFDENKNTPNGTDYYVWVGERFTVANAPGGSHRLLENDTMVVLLPMMGDPTQLIVIDCIPNKKDPPHPEMNRANKTYGHATKGGVVHLEDDSDQSSYHTYPHGVTRKIGGDGSFEVQTLDKAKLRLEKNAQIYLENPSGSIDITPEGQITYKNKSETFFRLESDGEIKGSIPSGGGIELLHDLVKVSGPIAQGVAEIEKIKNELAQKLGESSELLGQMDDVMGMDQLEDKLKGATGILESLSGGLGSMFEQGLKSLEQFAQLAPQALANAVLEPVQSAIASGLSEITKKVKDILGDVDPEQAVANLIKEFPQLTSAQDVLLDTVTQLAYHPQEQLKGVVDYFQDVTELQPLFNLGLIENLEQIDQAIEARDIPAIKGLWQDELINETEIEQALNTIHPLPYLIARSQQLKISKLKERLAPLRPLVEKIRNTELAVKAIRNKIKITPLSYHLNQLAQLPEYEGINTSKIQGKPLPQWEQEHGLIGNQPFGRLLGRRNPSVIRLSSLDKKMILEQLGYGTVDLSNWLGTDYSQFPLKKILAEIELGTVNLDDYGIDTTEIDLMKTSINNIFSKVNAIKDLSKVDLNSINLATFLGSRKQLENIPVRELIKDEINDISLGDVMKQDIATPLSEAINTSAKALNFNKLDLSTLTNGLKFNDIDPSQADFPETAIEPTEAIKQEVNDLLEKLTEPLKDLKQQIDETLEPLGDVIDSVNQGTSALTLTLTKTKGELKSIDGVGMFVENTRAELYSNQNAKVYVDQDKAEIISANTQNRITANDQEAVVSTPFAELGISEQGSKLQSQVPIEIGIGEGDSSPQAFVKLEDKKVVIGSSPDSIHKIEIGEDGIYIDGCLFKCSYLHTHNGGGGGGGISIGDLIDILEFYARLDTRCQTFQFTQSVLPKSVNFDTNSNSFLVDGGNSCHQDILLTTDAIIANPILPCHGATYTFHLIQDSVGGHIPQWENDWDFGEEGVPDISLEPNSRTIMGFECRHHKFYFCGFRRGFDLF
jgi:hypothetical protein